MVRTPLGGSSHDLDMWLITMVIISPLTAFISLPNGLFNGFEIGVILTTYKSWDDPPGRELNLPNYPGICGYIKPPELLNSRSFFKKSQVSNQHPIMFSWLWYASFEHGSWDSVVQ